MIFILEIFTEIKMANIKKKCNNFFRNGNCYFGEKCNFCHEITEEFIFSDTVASFLKEKGYEIKSIPDRKLPNLSSDIEFPLPSNKKSNQSVPVAKRSISTQTQDDTESVITKISEQETSSSEYFDGNDDNDEINHILSNVNEKVVNDFLIHPDTCMILGYNNFSHIYLRSNIWNIINGFKK